MNLTSPLYKHDCDHCTYLGPYTFDAQFANETREVTVDLYACKAQEDEPDDYTTLIARRGDEGSEYTSFDIGVLKNNGFLSMRSKQPNMGTYTWALLEAYDRYTDNKREG